MPLADVSPVEAVPQINGGLHVVPRRLTTVQVAVRHVAIVPTGNIALVVPGLQAVLVRPTTTVPVAPTPLEDPAPNVALAPPVITALVALASVLVLASSVVPAALANSEMGAPTPPVGLASHALLALEVSIVTLVAWRFLTTRKVLAKPAHLAEPTKDTDKVAPAPAPVLADLAIIALPSSLATAQNAPTSTRTAIAMVLSPTAKRAIADGRPSSPPVNFCVATPSLATHSPVL
jgi:hypothetical protein